jgi:hypothetical protein
MVIKVCSATAEQRGRGYRVLIAFLVLRGRITERSIDRTISYRGSRTASRFG